MEYKLKTVDELEFSDDYMFCAIMKDDDICKEILQRLLHIEIEKIERPVLQKGIKPFYSTKGVRLDVYVKDSDKIYDIEMQSYKEKDIAKRSRYYQSMIDADQMLKGTSYAELKETYIIFICKEDPFNRNLPVYTFKNICRQKNDLILNDKTTKLFYNTSRFKDVEDPKLNSFLKYVYSNTPTDDFTTALENKISLMKINDIFRSTYMIMSLHEQTILLRGKEEGKAEGKTEGIKEGIIRTAEKMLENNVPVENIILYTNLSKEEIENLKKKS